MVPLRAGASPRPDPAAGLTALLAARRRNEEEGEKGDEDEPGDEEGDEEEAGKKLAQETRPDADFSSTKGDRDNADSSKNA